MILSVQCKAGGVGEKPVTTLSYKTAGIFFGLINTGKYQYGVNDGGIWQLNYTSEDEVSTDDGQQISYSIRLNTSDFGYIGNLKKIMYVYVVMSSSASCSETPALTMQADEQQDELSFFKGRISQKQIRFPIKCKYQGAYWTVGLESNTPYTLFSISVNFIIRPTGISNG